jgi:hypothetical protein
MKNQSPNITEHHRLSEDRHRTRNWKRWGPYLSERQWAGPEDGSPSGNCADSSPHGCDRGRAYRDEGELLGITDRRRQLCFALALWNERDPILKERLVSCTDAEGDHCGDVKECYYHLESTPTFSYAKALYKYPQADVPPARLVDTAVSAEDGYFDVFTEYAKAGPEDICIRITVVNRGPDTATLHVLPTLWFRDTCNSGGNGCSMKPAMALVYANLVRAKHDKLGSYLFGWEGEADALFTDSGSNAQSPRDLPNVAPFAKDAFHQYLVDGRHEAVNPAGRGGKCAPHFVLALAPGETRILKLRLVREKNAPALSFGKVFAQVFADRKREADEFHASVVRVSITGAGQNMARQGRENYPLALTPLPLRAPWASFDADAVNGSRFTSDRSFPQPFSSGEGNVGGLMAAAHHWP